MAAPDTPGPGSARIAVDDLVFDALVAGPDDGATVVLLHGFPQTAQCWRHQQDALTDAGYRSIALDQRGYSPGARPTDDGAYRMAALAGDVLGVADELGLDRFHVVGHDWGGFVAWWLGARHADRIASVAAVSTPHPRAMGRALRLPEQRLRSFYFPLFSAEPAARVLGGGGAMGLRGLFALSGLPGPLAAPYVERARSDPGWLPAALAWYRANTGPELSHLAGTGDVAVRTLYVWSTRDSALGPFAAHLTGRYVSGPYRFVVLQGVSHWVPEMAPDSLNRALLAHLAAADG